jgi:hypothetical protein
VTDEQNGDALENIESIESVECPQSDEPQETSAGRQAYNVVTDIATGPNIRMSDNCFQAAFIFVSLLLGAGIGALIGDVGGAIVGAFAGLVGGLILSGIILMIYRAVQHAKGQHN